MRTGHDVERLTPRGRTPVSIGANRWRMPPVAEGT
jgi:hypothetical protein